MAAAVLATATASQAHPDTPSPTLAELADAKPWETLPAPRPLPPFDLEGRVSHEGAEIWFAAIGTGPPVVLLHGGDASSDYWGEQVPPLLAAGRRVVLIDSRGHGRSTFGDRRLGYELMETDVIAVLDQLGVRHADVVGWSDGAIIGLVMAMKHPGRVGRVFAFGANMDLHGFNPLGAVSPILPRVEAALAAHYARVSPTPAGYDALSKAVLAMQLREPNYAPQDLAAISGPAIAIVDGGHEEFILRQHTEYLARTIPGARLILLPNGSHFAPVQVPDEFNDAMIGFLAGAMPATSTTSPGHSFSGTETDR
jgi:pimeloyl-ACP methyl ester carboxylesterase